MRTLAALLLLIALPALAQDIRIRTFTGDDLIWTSDSTNVQYGIQFTRDLRESWHAMPIYQWPIESNSLTNSVLDFPGGIWDLAVVSVLLSQETDTPADTPMFFRVVASSNTLYAPETQWSVSLHNSATTAVSDVSLSTTQGTEWVGDLAAGTTTGVFQFAQEDTPTAVASASWGRFALQYRYWGADWTCGFKFPYFGASIRSATGVLNETSLVLDNQSFASFVTVFDGDFFGSATNVVLRTPSELDSFWGSEPSKPEDIDFSSAMLIGVFMGTRANTGPTIRVKLLVSDATGLTVRYVITDPSETLPGFSGPCHLIAVPTSELPVEFRSYPFE